MTYVHVNERVCTPLNNKDMGLAHINLIMFIMMIIKKEDVTIVEWSDLT